MFEIIEKRSKKLPCETSLFFELPYYDKYIYDYLVQTQESKYDAKTKIFEFPINRLYYLVSFLTKYDEVKFTPYKEKEKTNNRCDIKKFKIKPYKYQEIGINFGLNNDKWLLMDEMGLGKMEPVSSLIPTIDGFKKMGDIKEGDWVFGRDGKPCQVLRTYHHENKEIYRVTFNDNTYVDCGLDHQWLVRDANRRLRNGGWITKSTRDIIEQGITYGQKRKTLKWEIPQTCPVEYTHKDFFIHPYILGICIGDGNLCNGEVNISIPDSEIFIANKIESLLNDEYKLTKDTFASCPRYRVVAKKYNRFNKYIREIQRLGLNVKGNVKFIPEEYKFGSIEQRLELLYGLMDSDGSISKRGNKISFCSTSEKLVSDVIEIVNSLGGIAKKHRYSTTKKYKGRERELVTYVASLNVQINPFSLPRKRERYTAVTGRYCHRYIKDISFNRVEDAQCITVSSDDHTYLSSRNYIVTHNTVQMIYLAEELKRTKKIKHCLIICGVSSLQVNWAKEIEKFSKLSYNLLSKGKTKTGKEKQLSVSERLKKLKNKINEFFVIVNIETLQDKNFIKAFRESKNTFDMIVCDEIHKVKNPQSKSAKTLLKLEAEYMIGLSGTVIMNVPENAYVPLKWTKNTSSTFTDFKHLYNVYGGFNNVQVIGYKNLDLLQEVIEKHSIRRLKTDVLDLPEKVYQVEYVDMYKEQRDLYDEVAQGIALELDKLPKKPTILQELAINIRLRQITAFPGMLSSTITKSAKLDRLQDLIEDIVSQGDRVVVFNTFKEAVKEEYKLLSKYKPLYCTGDNTDEEIRKNVERFQSSDENKVMLCTWQKMGTGFTLTGANYCIFVDIPFTRAAYDQASDRVHRIGQNKTTFIIELVCNNSYDERVREIVNIKKELSDFIVDNKTIETLNILG